MTVSKGLAFPMVALPGVGHMPAPVTARPAPPKRPIGFLTHEDKKTPKASTLTKGRKAP